MNNGILIMIYIKTLKKRKIKIMNNKIVNKFNLNLIINKNTKNLSDSIIKNTK